MTSTPFRRLHHICFVVHEIDKSVAYYESIGIGPWQEYPPLTEYTDLDVPNPEAFYAMRYRLANLENVQLQLCEPPALDCPQRRFLDAHGEGVFHVGFESDVDVAAEQGRALGLDVIMRGQRPNGSGFVYFDTLDQAGAVLMARKTAT
ncbi:MAG: methylmalonyl-CoA/ethylmalonyl-CoA epimerase [Pseudonocardiales bacterium]|jgi:catechol 2,3-dioxygenase-like lactoylglutathione lyase family enzyme|nr:methylmalonyl-CoA/ethylmalonyl-CoA epimerase [Pseudonocardiales bacterium]MDT4932038.1 methylmalonyl-CoA/ethylmalonyl-CoA epimerase [Pseudonocardiales bacterium]